MRTVLVPRVRVERWFANFATRHGEADLAVDRGALTARAADGAHARAALPFDREYGGPPEPGAFAAAMEDGMRWGVLLVRKGGFAVAVVSGAELAAAKVGQRHVQGRSKAGGQSQQRFARRRQNQARQAYEAAADHAHRVLVAEGGRLGALVCGGDRSAVDAVLADPRLQPVVKVRTSRWLDVPDPRRAVLQQAIQDAASASVTVTPGPGGSS